LRLRRIATWAALLLLAIGIVMVYSSSIAMAEASAHTGNRAWYFLARHSMFVAAGIAAASVAFQIPCERGRSSRRTSSSQAPCCWCSCSFHTWASR
jgi:cell division protein FtsW (lipid II flippase)